MKKFKILAIASAFVMATFLSACGGNTASSSISESPQPIPAATESSVSSDIEEESSAEATQDEESPVSQTEDQPEQPDAPAESGALSSDPFSYQVQLDGVVYTLPAPYSQFADNGWVNEDYATATIRPNSVSLGDIAKNGAETITLYMANTGSEEVTYDKAHVSKIMLDEYNAKNGAELIFPGGITLGSTEEQVLAAYGQPGDITETSSQKSFYYSTSIYSVVKITINTDTNTVTILAMENVE